MGTIKPKNIILAILMLLVVIIISGCTSNDKDVKIYTKWYVNTSETVLIGAYNGNKLVKSNIIENEDGSIRVELIFDKPIKE